MTRPGQSWNEATLSEDPAVEHLRRLGYTYLAPEALDLERDSLKEVVLPRRLAAALKRLNPWISDENVAKAIRAVTAAVADQPDSISDLANGPDTAKKNAELSAKVRPDRNWF